MSRCEIDNSWEALLQPGLSTTFFRSAPLPQITSPARQFCPAFAWWLAELSRLVYVQESDETGESESGPTRSAHLEPVGGEELRFFSRHGTQAALVKLNRAGAAPIHALVFRGTHDFRDWLSNINVLPGDWPGGGRVHRGFVEALDQVWDEIDAALSILDDDGGQIFYTGHSLGGAMATLAAARRAPDGLYTFGAPRVGDAAFNRSLADIPVHRIVNDRDIVAMVPTPGPLLRYVHPGHLHRLTRDGRCMTDPKRPALSARLQDAVTRMVQDLFSRPLHEPPGRLSDHAPVNYCARLDQICRGGADVTA